VIRNKVKTTHV